jgi:hypothetical protein
MMASPDDLPPIPPVSRIARLGDADAAAADRMLEDGFDPDRSPADDREAAVRELLGLLDDYPVEPASDELVHATLARVARSEAEREQRMHFQNSPEVGRRRVRLPDFFAVAAALLFAVGIGWPLLDSIDSQQRIMQSKNRLGAVNGAIAGFAGDWNGLLPFDRNVMAEEDDQGTLPCAVGGDWSRHLHQLAEQERLQSGHLFVDDDSQSARPLVSYRVAWRLKTFRLDMHQPGDALAGDPNPVIIAFRQHFRPCHHTEGSLAHDGRGVVILRFDGSTPFLETAETAGHDSIWVDDDYDQDLGETQKIRPAHKDDDVLSQ